MESIQFSGFQRIHRVAQPSPQSTLEHFCHFLKNAYTRQQSLPSPPPPPQPQTTTGLLLSLYIRLFYTIHINRIIQYVVFSDWLHSLSIVFASFIHVVICTVLHFFFIAEQYSIVWIYHILFIHLSVDEHSGCLHFWLL